MQSSADEACYAGASPLERARSFDSRRLREAATALAGLGFSCAILVAVLTRVGGLELSRLATAPRNPLFWLAFALFYALQPVIDWVILRRQWGLGVNGLLPLFRKQVANEIVLGYSGEAQFYLWARRHLGLRGSVFGTLRDVTVLSALAGNLITLLLTVATAPLLYRSVSGSVADTLIASTAVIILSSLAILVLRQRLSLFAMPRREIWITFGLHCLRVLLSLMLVALMWKMLLPGVAIPVLAVIATLRLMVHRLPFVPARDTLLAALVFALLGAHAGLAAAATLVAALTLATHLLVGIFTLSPTQ